MNAEHVGRGLSAAFLAGVWEPQRMAERGRDALRLRRDRKFQTAVTTIAQAEGFRVAAHKTRLRGADQRQLLTGLVVNSYPQPQRAQIDRLRTIIHDAVLHGPESANRHQHPDFAAHLLGRVAWVEAHNPRRGERLRTQFARINWDG